MPNFAYYCTCGAALTGRIGAPGGTEALSALWDKAHSGLGHAPATPAQASAARRRADATARRVASGEAGNG